MDLIRNIDSTLYAELQKQVIYPILLVYIDWPSGVVRAHSGTGALTYDGETWIGVGELGGITIPDEAGGVVPSSAVLEIASTVDGLLAHVDEVDARGKQVDIYLGATTTPGGVTLVGVPHRFFTGSVSKSDFDLADDRRIATLTVQVKSGQPARASAQIVHSDEDQQVTVPGDTIFRRVAHAEKWRTNPPQWPAS